MGEPVPPILIQPMNPFGFTDQDLSELAERVRAFDSNRDVHIAYYDDATTALLTPWETIAIWFDSDVSETGIEQVADQAAEWLKERYGRDSRPKALMLARYEGESGKVFEVWEIKDPSKVAEIVHLSGFDTRYRPVPPVSD